MLIADAQKVKGSAPLACKTDNIDAHVLAVLSARELVPAIWLPDPGVRREREQARFRLHLASNRHLKRPRDSAAATAGVGSMSAPTIQSTGKMIPNQKSAVCPLRSVLMPSVTHSVM